MGELVMNPMFGFYKGKRVLVTGDTGFKGSWLCLWLTEMGAKVAGYSLPPEHDQGHYRLLGLDRMIRHIDGDIRELDPMRKVFSGFQPEIVFHLAAQALVRKSYQDPKYTFDTNLGGSVNVLEAVRHCPSVRSLVFITSDKCYQNKEWVWGYRENDELGGRDPYSASKAAAESIFYAYWQSFFADRPDFGCASVRAGNVIGGGDWAADRIVPDCVRALQANGPIILRNPGATRPWQHVLEPLSGYLVTAMKLYEDSRKYSGSWNFGPAAAAVRTVKELADLALIFWGQGEVRVVAESCAPHESNLLQLNCDKAYQLLQWRSRWDFERTVKETITWYRAVGEGTAAVEFSRQQIAAYTEADND